MKKVAIFSLSLVALSGTAGLGLSVLHEFNMNVHSSALATPDNLPADSGFVIPDYVPDAAQFASFAPTLTSPPVIEAPALEPVETAALGDLDMPQDENTQDIAVDDSLTNSGAIATRSERASDRGPSTRTSPEFVAQTATPQSIAPIIPATFTYMMGVYR